MVEVLQALNNEMQGLGLNYEYDTITDPSPTFPYWVGAYSEDAVSDESGQETAEITLTGFSIDMPLLVIETQKKQIKDHFINAIRVTTENENVVFFYFSGSVDVPIDEFGVRKSEIRLKVIKFNGGI
ncbi:MAG: hypothetical protein LBS74_02880 [Oscillospiraceae bacterium]|nr:hypothetical protein [Oscillospiraceae bacterium]